MCLEISPEHQQQSVSTWGCSHTLCISHHRAWPGVNICSRTEAGGRAALYDREASTDALKNQGQLVKGVIWMVIHRVSYQKIPLQIKAVGVSYGGGVSGLCASICLYIFTKLWNVATKMLQNTEKGWKHCCANALTSAWKLMEKIKRGQTHFLPRLCMGSCTETSSTCIPNYVQASWSFSSSTFLWGGWHWAKTAKHGEQKSVYSSLCLHPSERDRLKSNGQF